MYLTLLDYYEYEYNWGFRASLFNSTVRQVVHSRKQVSIQPINPPWTHPFIPLSNQSITHPIIGLSVSQTVHHETKENHKCSKICDQAFNRMVNSQSKSHRDASCTKWVFIIFNTDPRMLNANRWGLDAAYRYSKYLHSARAKKESAFVFEQQEVQWQRLYLTTLRNMRHQLVSSGWKRLRILYCGYRCNELARKKNYCHSIVVDKPSKRTAPHQQTSHDTKHCWYVPYI